MDVQLMRLLCFVVLAAWPMGSSATSAHDASRLDPAACAAAAAALESLEPGPRLFSDAPPGATGQTVETLTAGEFTARWQGKAPAPELLPFVQANTSRPALSCDVVQQRAGQLGEIVGEAEGRSRIDGLRTGPSTTFLYRVSYPALDRSGQHAVVAVLRSSNRLAGDLRLLHLERSEGAWRVVGSKILLRS